MKKIKGMSDHPWHLPYDNEADFLSDAKRWLELQRRRGIKLIRINERIQQGYSDLFVCVRGMFVVLELKDNTGKPSQQQLKFIEEMHQAGAIGDVVSTMDEVKHYIDVALACTPFKDNDSWGV